MEISASGELGEFMEHFNHFVEMAASKVQLLEQDKERLLTSSKLLTYRKNRVETVLETLPEAVMILDESGTVTFANQKLAAMFNVTPETILTQPPQSWCEHPDVLNRSRKIPGPGQGAQLHRDHALQHRCVHGALDRDQDLPAVRREEPEFADRHLDRVS